MWYYSSIRNFVLVFFVTFNLLASGNGSQEHSINWLSLGLRYKDSPALIWQILTFLIFISLFLFFLKKPLSSYLFVRSENFKKLIKDAEMAVVLAEKEKLKLEKRQDTLKKEVLEIQDTFKLQGEAEKKEIIESAHLNVKRIKESTKNHIKAEILQAKRYLKLQIINMAILKSKDYLKKNMSKTTDQTLQESFIQKFPTI